MELFNLLDTNTESHHHKGQRTLVQTKRAGFLLALRTLHTSPEAYYLASLQYVFPRFRL